MNNRGGHRAGSGGYSNPNFGKVDFYGGSSDGPRNNNY